eukprot:882246-Amphidinium_carterae.1
MFAHATFPLLTTDLLVTTCVSSGPLAGMVCTHLSVGLLIEPLLGTATVPRTWGGGGRFAHSCWAVHGTQHGVHVLLKACRPQSGVPHGSCAMAPQPNAAAADVGVRGLEWAIERNQAGSTCDPIGCNIS